MKVAIYPRTSTPGKERETLDMQKEKCLKYLEQELEEPFEHEFFIDDAKSGRDIYTRPKFMEMKGRVESGEFQAVCVYKWSRFGRNFLQTVQVIEDFDKLGILFLSPEEKINLSTAMGRALFRIMMVIAQLDREATSEWVTDTKIKMAREGRLTQGKLPLGYGYSKEKGAFLIPEEAKKVKEIFRLYTKGWQQTPIAQKIFGDRKYQGKVSTILKTTCYSSGMWEKSYKGEPLTIPVPIIIEPELADKARKILESNKNIGRTTIAHHLFSDKLVCNECGAHFWVQNSWGGKYNYYQPTCKCSRKSIKSDRLDEMLWANIEHAMARPAIWKESIKKVRGDYSEEKILELQGQLEGLEKERETWQNRKRKWMMEFADKDADVKKLIEEANENLNRLNYQANQINRQIENIKKVQDSLKSNEKDIVTRITSKKLKKGLTFEEKKKVVDELLAPHSIYMAPPGKVGKLEPLLKALDIGWMPVRWETQLQIDWNRAFYNGKEDK